MNETVNRAVLDEVIRCTVRAVQLKERISAAARSRMEPGGDPNLLVVRARLDAIVAPPRDLERYRNCRGRVLREALGEARVVYGIPLDDQLTSESTPVHNVATEVRIG